MVIDLVSYMKIMGKTSQSSRGFSLAEVIATLTIGSMVLVVVLGLYNRASRSAVAVTEKLNSSNLSSEILQRIAEDLDNIIETSSDITITIQNEFNQGYPTARMIIENNVYDDKNELQTFKKIVWQGSYDFESPIPGLSIYRSQSGMALEDKLLDKQKESWERELFIPLCNGVTLFRIQAIRDNKAYDSWEIASLPHAVEATISFAEPFETLDGTLDVFEEDKTKRTVVIDRTRRMGFTFITKYNLDLEEPKDVNEPSENMKNADDVNEIAQGS
ncbi:MAG: type IV pilus modification PilV family protein [Planctomycetota bacterium]|jgi:prepilin-type N-terminal cleavage/methylation domain-containing protein